MSQVDMSNPFDNYKSRHEYANSLSADDQGEYSRWQWVMYQIGAERRMQKFRWITDLFIVLGSWASVTIEVFIRKDFGERYLSAYRLQLGFIVLGVYTLLLWMFPVLSLFYRPVDEQYFPWELVPLLFYIPVYLVAGRWHRFQIWYAEMYEGRMEYSRSIGRSLWFASFLGKRSGVLPPIDEYFLYQYVEPGVCFVIGWVLLLLGMVSLQAIPTQPLGQWIMLASVALWFRNSVAISQEREEAQNLNDAHIRASFMARASQGQAPETLAGYRQPPLPAAAFSSLTLETWQPPQSVDLDSALSERLAGIRSSAQEASNDASSGQ